MANIGNAKKIATFKMANNVNPQIDFQHTIWPKKATHKNDYNIQNRISTNKKANIGNHKQNFNKQKSQNAYHE